MKNLQAEKTLKFIRLFIDFIKEYDCNTLVLYLEGKVRTSSFPYPSPEESYIPEEMKEVVAYRDAKKAFLFEVVRKWEKEHNELSVLSAREVKQC